MGSTNAERQRRYRAHKRGDHSGCDPARCDGTAVTPSPVTTVTRNAEGVAGLRVPRLGRRGRWLWEQLVEGSELSPADRVLIEEACRLADRLDRLDAISNGRDRVWLQLVDELPDVDGQVTVVVDKVLSEARQQQATLKQILAELRQSQGSASAGGKRPPAGPKSSGGEGVAGVADLTARIAGRRANPAG